MKFIAPFAYTAEVLPRGSRKPRREVLFATMEHEIVELSHSDLVRDAVVITPASRYNQPPTRVSLAGHNGKLWSPIAVDPHFLGQHLSDVESFLRSCASVYPDSHGTDNPLSCAYDQIYGPRRFPRNDDGSMLERYREDLYDGKIINSSGRGASIERYHERARDIILVGGDSIYVRRPEPFWETILTVACSTKLYAAPRWVDNAHRFRIDRLHDVHAWVDSRYGEFAPEGEIHQFDPSFLSRNDLSFFLTGHLRDLIKKSVSYLPYLDATTVLAWHRLSQSKDTTGPQVNTPFPADLEATIQDLHRLHDGLTAMHLPASYLTTHETMLRDVLAPFFRRLDFELARQPHLTLNVIDEDAVSHLSAS